MANKEHLAILRQGVDAWNRWRKENPEVKPDLRGAFLSYATLVETNLKGAVLDGCHIYGISAWNLELDEDTKQEGLIITPHGQVEGFQRVRAS